MNNIYKEAARNSKAAFVLLLSISILAVAAVAAPPNDNFANAQLIIGNSATVNTTNVTATKEPAEQPHGFNRGGASVWYKWVAPGNGVMRFDTLGTGFNTLLAVYTGSTLGNLRQIASNDEDDSQSGSSKVYFGTISGTTYYIAVDGKFYDGTGVLTGSGLKINYSFENVAPNDNFANATVLRNDLPVYSATTTNLGASKEIGEPNHGAGGNPGGKSVWFSWQAPLGVPRTYSFTLEQKGVANPANYIIPLLGIYTGSSIGSLTNVGFYNADRTGQITFRPQPGVTYFIAIDGWDFGGGAGSMLGNFNLSVAVAKSIKTPDIDYDSKGDLAVYRPTTGIYYTLDSSSDNFRATQWGLNGDKPLYAEIDGDNKSDPYIYRPDTQTWYIYRTFSNTFTAANWGISIDAPLVTIQNTQSGPIGYPTVFRQATGTWWVYRFGNSPIQFSFGQVGDIPMTADFTGDGTDEVAVFRPSNGTWYIGNPFTGQYLNAIQFGQSGDLPVPADYNGDGVWDIAIFRPSTATWWFRDGNTGAQTAKQFGVATDKPQPADYDGDGKADVAIFRPTTGDWWILQSSSGTAKSVHFGSNGDIPVAAPLY